MTTTASITTGHRSDTGTGPSTMHELPAMRTSRFPLMLAAGGVLGALMVAAFLHRATSVQPFLPEGMSIWLAIHIASVAPCLPLGAYVMMRPKGTATHRALGKVWASLMALAALSSFGLQGLTGTVGPIHVLSIVVLVTLARGIAQARKGDIRRHQRSMQGAFIGLLLAGMAAFVPGRLMFAWLVG